MLPLLFLKDQPEKPTTATTATATTAATAASEIVKKTGLCKYLYLLQ